VRGNAQRWDFRRDLALSGGVVGCVQPIIACAVRLCVSKLFRTCPQSENWQAKAIHLGDLFHTREVVNTVGLGKRFKKLRLAMSQNDIGRWFDQPSRARGNQRPRDLYNFQWLEGHPHLLAFCLPRCSASAPCGMIVFCSHGRCN
jgi:hypothetical protein